MRALSRDDVVARLCRRIKQAGSQAAVARELKITPAYLSDVLQGHTKPGPKVLRALGLRRVEVFVADRGGKRQ